MFEFIFGIAVFIVSAYIFLVCCGAAYLVIEKIGTTFLDSLEKRRKEEKNGPT